MRYLLISVLALALLPATASAGHGKWTVGFGFGFVNYGNYGGNCGYYSSPNCNYGYYGNGSLYPAPYPYRYYAPYSRLYGEGGYYPPRPFVAPPVGVYNPPPRPFCPPSTYNTAPARDFCPPTYIGPAGSGSTYSRPGTYNVQRSTYMRR